MLSRISQSSNLTHCSDELLVSFMDGELSSRAASRVERHLQDCWHCRTNLAELERQTQLVVQAFNDSPDFGPTSSIEGKAELLRRARKWESQLPLPEPQFGRMALRRSAAPLAIALACSVLIALFLQQRRNEPDLSAQEVIASTRQLESREAGTALRQEMQVSIERSGPRAGTRHGKLQIWSDAPQNEYAAHWSDSHGHVRQAMWTDHGQQIVFRPAGGPRMRLERASDSTLANLAHDVWEAEDLEAAFLQWLERRQWKPLLLGEDFALLTSRHGFVLQVERGSENSLRVSAWNDAAGRQIRALLVLDAESRRPRLHRIELTQGDRKVAISLAVTRHSQLEAGAMPARWFQSFTQPRTHREPVLPEFRQDSQALDEPETAVDALYALHRVNACLGEAIEVRTESGQVVVRGMVESAARKEVILAALAGVGPELARRAQIRTVGELIAASNLRAPEPLTEQDQLEVIESRPSQIEAEVRQALGLTAAGMTRFAEDTLGSASDVLDHAWALRRLHAAESEANVQSLPVHARWLLETMRNDHLRAAREHAQQLQQKLAPALEALAPAGATAANTGESDDNSVALLSRLVADAQSVRSFAEIFVGAAQQGARSSAGTAVGLRRSLNHLQVALDSLENKASRDSSADAKDSVERNAR